MMKYYLLNIGKMAASRTKEQIKADIKIQSNQFD